LKRADSGDGILPSRKTAGLATLRESRLKTAKTNQGCARFVIFSRLSGWAKFMSETIIVDLKDETRVRLDEAAREEGMSQNELIDKALRDYLFIRRFRSLRERTMSHAGTTFTDQDVFDLVS